jgi:hypothetical protein
VFEIVIISSAETLSELERSEKARQCSVRKNYVIIFHSVLKDYWIPQLRPNPMKNMVFGSLAGVDYNLTLMSTPESTPTHLPWATLCQSRRVNAESTLSPSQGL